jgi:hypothetical protein
VWLADPGRPPAQRFLEAAERDWSIAAERGTVTVHRMRRRQPPAT